MTWMFDKNYKNTEQVEDLMPAFLARFAELDPSMTFAYNDSFRGHMGIDDSPNQDTAIYLCQTLKRRRELAGMVSERLAEGYVPVDHLDGSVRCAAVFYYGWDMSGTSHKEWTDVRLVPYRSEMMVMPKRARTRGYLVSGGHILAKVAA